MVYSLESRNSRQIKKTRPLSSGENDHTRIVLNVVCKGVCLAANHTAEQPTLAKYMHAYTATVNKEVCVLKVGSLSLDTAPNKISALSMTTTAFALMASLKKAATPLFLMLVVNV